MSSLKTTTTAATKRPTPMSKPKTRAVADLAADPKNPRTADRGAIANLKRRLAEFGDLGGIVYNRTTKHLVGGHQRVKTLDPAWNIHAEPHTDKTGTVAVGYIETPNGRLQYREVEWKPAKERAANIAANVAAGQFDDGLLADAIESLKVDGIDLELTGLSSDEVDKILSETTDAVGGEDDLPERAAKGAPTRAKRGELWLLGDHRLLVDDCTRPGNLERLMNGETAALVFTDPPYGVSYEAKSGQFDVIAGDTKTGDDLLKTLLTPALKAAVAVAARDAAFYVWHASSTRDEFSAALKAAGLVERQYLIWAKPGGGLGHTDYRWAHEPCFYASRPDVKPAFYGDPGQPTVWRCGHHTKAATAIVVGTGVLIQDGDGNSLYLTARPPSGKKARAVRLEKDRALLLESGPTERTTVWEVGRDHGYKHPTQKPVELARRAIENSSRKGQVVLDMFLGSGTTLLGAEATGRRCFGTELDPVYADVIIERWEGATQREAVRYDGR